MKSRPYVEDITSDYSGTDPEVSVEVVSDMVRFTYKFAEDLGFKPKLVKNKRFSIDPGIRAALAWPSHRAILSRPGGCTKLVQQGVGSQGQAD